MNAFLVAVYPALGCISSLARPVVTSASSHALRPAHASRRTIAAPTVSTGVNPGISMRTRMAGPPGALDSGASDSGVASGSMVRIGGVKMAGKPATS